MFSICLFWALLYTINKEFLIEFFSLFIYNGYIEIAKTKAETKVQTSFSTHLYGFHESCTKHKLTMQSSL